MSRYELVCFFRGLLIERKILLLQERYLMAKLQSHLPSIKLFNIKGKVNTISVGTFLLTCAGGSPVSPGGVGIRILPASPPFCHPFSL